MCLHPGPEEENPVPSPQCNSSLRTDLEKFLDPILFLEFSFPDPPHLEADVGLAIGTFAQPGSFATLYEFRLSEGYK